MKVSSLLTGMAIAGLVTVGNVSLNAVTPTHTGSSTLAAISGQTILGTAAAEAAEGPSVQQKIELIAKNKGQVGSGDQLRRFFYGDLEPLGVQPGGAGMVVNLYNKANNVTFSYCSTYDVVVAVKQGKVKMFPANEVK
jgi:hypothetical protein